jgi:hypothetical protein
MSLSYTGNAHMHMAIGQIQVGESQQFVAVLFLISHCMSFLVGPVSGTLVVGGVRHFLRVYTSSSLTGVPGILWVLQPDSHKVS